MVMEGELMRIAVCDDDGQERKQIMQLVREFFIHSCGDEQADIFEFDNSMDLIAKVSSGKRFDIFLLDVVMTALNGIELAAEIRKYDTVAKIIFLTSSAEFAVKSYTVDAFHYLLKPVDREAFLPVLEKAFRDIDKALKEFLLVETQNELVKIFFHQLCYVEVIGRRIYFNQKDGVAAECISAISRIEEQLLKDKRFIKSHRSYIVNMDYVRTLTKDGFIMINDQFVPVSRNAYKSVKQVFFEYLS